MLTRMNQKRLHFTSLPTVVHFLMTSSPPSTTKSSSAGLFTSHAANGLLCTQPPSASSSPSVLVLMSIQHWWYLAHSSHAVRFSVPYVTPSRASAVRFLPGSTSVSPPSTDPTQARAIEILQRYRAVKLARTSAHAAHANGNLVARFRHAAPVQR